MKKSLMTLSLLFVAANAFCSYQYEGEINLRTPVINNSKVTIRATWTASGWLASKLRDFLSHLKATDWKEIVPGSSEAFWHTGDTLVVRYADSNGKEQEVRYDAASKGYGTKGIEVTSKMEIKSVGTKVPKNCPPCDCSLCPAK